MQHAFPTLAKLHICEHAEHPPEPLLEPPLDPPELPELLVLCVEQLELTHAWPALHTWQALPAEPQLLLSAVPFWQFPLVSQHPEQVAAQAAPPLLEPVLEPPPLLPEAVPESSPVGVVASSPVGPLPDDELPLPLADPPEDP